MTQLIFAVKYIHLLLNIPKRFEINTPIAMPHTNKVTT